MVASVGQVPPAWRIGLTHSEVDDIVAVPGKRVFVCTSRTEAESHNRRMHYGPCLMLDSDTGKEIWRHQRVDDTRNSYVVVATDPAVVVMRVGPDGSHAEALHPDTGARQWQRDWPRTAVFARDRSSGSLVFLHQGTLLMLEPLTGKVVFETKIERSGKAPRLIAQEDRLLVAGDSVTAVAVPTGKIEWRVDAGALTPDAAPLQLADGGLVLPLASGRLTRIAADGRQDWSIDLSVSARVLAATGNWVFAELPADPTKVGSTAKLQAFDARTGRLAWSIELEPAVALVSAIVPAGDRLLFVTARHPTSSDAERRLRITRAATGETIADVKIVSSDQFPPARLHVYPKHVVIQQEGQVAAHSLANGERLWMFYDANSYSKPSSYALYRDRLWSLASSANVDNASEIIDRLDHRVLQLESVTGLANEQNLAVERSVRESRRRAGGSAPMTAWSRTVEDLRTERARLEPRAESGDNLAAAKLSSVVRYERLARNMAMLEASSNFMLRAREMQEEIFWAKLREGAVESFQIEIEQAALRLRCIERAASNALSGNLIVMPLRVSYFGDGRYSLLLVDMRDGRWAEVATGPTDVSSNVAHFNAMIPLVDRDAGKVYLRGLGLDPNRWTQYIAHDDEPKRHVAAGLLAYDLASFTFAPASEFRKEAIVLEGRRGPVPRPDPDATVAEMEAVLGPPAKVTPDQIVWKSQLMRLRADYFHQPRTEIVTCSLRGQRVSECEVEEVDRGCDDSPERCVHGRERAMKPYQVGETWWQAHPDTSKQDKICMSATQTDCRPAIHWRWNGSEWVELTSAEVPAGR